MTKFCTECGFENMDEANFCTNCGKSFENDIDLTNSKSSNMYFNPNTKNINKLNDNNNNQLINNQSIIQVPQKYNSYSLTGETQCINCKQNSFTHLNKKSILSDKWVYFCTNCGLTLEKHGKGFKIIDIHDKNNRMWRLYYNQILSREEWVRIADGGLSNKDQIEHDKQLALQKQQEEDLQRKQDLKILIESINNGKLSNVSNSPVMLKKNEEAFFSIPNVKLSEPRAVRVSQSGGYGTSYRIAKGVSVHSGSSQSRSVSHDQIMGIDMGTFVITNKRIVFLGSKKTVNIDLKKVLSVKAYKDGISIQRENKQKVEYFTQTDKSSCNFTVEGREHRFALEGPLVKAMILGQIKKLN